MMPLQKQQDIWQETQQQQQQHQHQQHRYQLTFKDICPKWAERLEQQKQQQQLPFPLSITWLRWYSQIRESSKCIVGEAHGYSSIYLINCRECRRFCIKFMYLFLLHWYSRLEKNKNLFVKHWNQKHYRMLASYGDNNNNNNNKGLLSLLLL
jgi:hypothetical protein